MATAIYGAIEEFDLINGIKINEYIERLEQYFIANDVTEDKKKSAIFLTVIGADTYTLLRNLVAPAAFIVGNKRMVNR